MKENDRKMLGWSIFGMTGIILIVFSGHWGDPISTGIGASVSIFGFINAGREIEKGAIKVTE